MCEAKLPVLKRELPVPKSLSKLEKMRNHYQEKVHREKEEKILTLFAKQQEYATQKVHGSSLRTSELRRNASSNERRNINGHHYPPSLHTAPLPMEEKNWASNWIVSKRSAGVDRAHPLKPVFHHKNQGSVKTETNIYRSQSAHSVGIKLDIPHPEEHLRLKSGPSRPEIWFQLQKTELSLEEEIYRKKVLLKEKLRRTEEELRRIQREKEAAELEDTSFRGISEGNRTMGKSDEGVGNLHNLAFTLKAKGKSNKHFRNQSLTYQTTDPQTIKPVSNNVTEREQPIHRGGTEREQPIHRGGNAREQPIHRGGNAREQPIHRGGNAREQPIHRGGNAREQPIHKGGNAREQPIHRGETAREQPIHRGGTEREQPIHRGGTEREQPIHRGGTEREHLSHRGGTEREHPTHRDGSPEFAAYFKEEEKNQILKDVPNNDAPELAATELVPCSLCGRQFLAHRLEKHTQVCQKMQQSNRKVFDSSKARAKGTDLEQYLQTKGRTQQNAPKIQNNAWKHKHESFQQTIRHARAVQQIIARGGKLSDLPPPPVEENPDYVTCPHCNRRFAPRVAERHIPKCENIKSKPRPLPPRRR
ncbi:zinc finger C2HC domain-containing protein 1C isoform X3 [Xenopus laevis]|uniref:Zinc finger C2HC domain-containing protein 1C isoform X2 n=1 Tax=Xenopus laevis TaxID=8355 RepID=A0A8J1LNA1_XENLA|nr:zinc finger C2HC domain-containing protein 1C isoform X2 [Xenopus laevis]XP_041430660.1 zinc finger C2HC domain-containing protein 1C isoform X3 [Xenopus laevis]